MEGICDAGWEQMVTDPTRGDNTLDLMLTNFPGLVPRVETLPGISDHESVYMELDIHPQRKRQPQRLIPIYTEESIKLLKNAVSKLSDNITNKFNETSEVEELWIEIRDGLKKALTDNVYHKKTKTKQSHPWVDFETKKLIRRRDRIHKKK